MKNMFNKSLMELNFIKIGLQIKINREHRGMSLYQLARKIGVTSTKMRSIEKGKLYCVKIETLLKISHAFDCALDIKLTSTLDQIKQIVKEPEIVPTFKEEIYHDRFCPSA